MVLKICSFWSKDPDWIYQLTKEKQITLLAFNRINQETKKGYQQRKKRYDKDRLDKRIAELKNGDKA